MKKALFTRKEWQALALGGCSGSVCRVFIAGPLETFSLAGVGLPPSTLANLSGTALLAVLYLFQSRFQNTFRFLSMVGFCGSFTTVSGFSLEIAILLLDGTWSKALFALFIPLISAVTLVFIVLRFHPQQQ